MFRTNLIKYMIKNSKNNLSIIYFCIKEILMKKQTLLILLTGIFLIAFTSWNKKVKESTDTKESNTGTVKKANKNSPPTQDEIIMADAIELVKASCETQRAKMEYQKDKSNSFKKMKFTNLRKHRNEIGEEMKIKYNSNPRTKQWFEEAKKEARESLSECKGLEKPQKEEQ